MNDGKLLILGVAMVATAAFGAVPTRAVTMSLPGDPVGRFESLWAERDVVAAVLVDGESAAASSVLRAPAGDLMGSKFQLGESSLLLLLGGALLGATWILRRSNT